MVMVSLPLSIFQALVIGDGHKSSGQNNDESSRSEAQKARIGVKYAQLLRQRYSSHAAAPKPASVIVDGSGMTNCMAGMPSKLLGRRGGAPPPPVGLEKVKVDAYTKLEPFHAKN